MLNHLSDLSIDNFIVIPTNKRSLKRFMNKIKTDKNDDRWIENIKSWKSLQFNSIQFNSFMIFSFRLLLAFTVQYALHFETFFNLSVYIQSTKSIYDALNFSYCFPFIIIHYLIATGQGKFNWFSQERNCFWIKVNNTNPTNERYVVQKTTVNVTMKKNDFIKSWSKKVLFIHKYFLQTKIH